MISFIICSTTSCVNPSLIQNINNACSIEKEIILLDNSNNDYSIFSAYNEGVKKAKYDYLCFIHEDIVFKSDNVGDIIVHTFNNNPNVGLIGVVGAKVLPRMPFGWWAAGSKYKVGTVREYPKKHKRDWKVGIGYGKIPILYEAVVCDGLFLCIRKKVFDNISWDDKTYKGFHCYDMDICMAIIAQGMKIVIAENLLIDHYSFGNPTESFACACSLFNTKWYAVLPISIPEITKDELNFIQLKTENECLKKLPLAIRYEHICLNPIGAKVLSLMKYLYKKLSRK